MKRLGLNDTVMTEVVVNVNNNVSTRRSTTNGSRDSIIKGTKEETLLVSLIRSVMQ